MQRRHILQWPCAKTYKTIVPASFFFGLWLRLVKVRNNEPLQNITAHYFNHFFNQSARCVSEGEKKENLGASETCATPSPLRKIGHIFILLLYWTLLLLGSTVIKILITWTTEDAIACKRKGFSLTKILFIVTTSLLLLGRSWLACS